MARVGEEENGVLLWRHISGHGPRLQLLAIP